MTDEHVYVLGLSYRTNKPLFVLSNLYFCPQVVSSSLETFVAKIKIMTSFNSSLKKSHRETCFRFHLNCHIELALLGY